MLVLTQTVVALPPHESYGQQFALEKTLSVVPVMVFASLTAYLCAQTHDVAAFAFWRRITKGRHLWLRNTLSTASSQLIDSVVFNVLLFTCLQAAPFNLKSFFYDDALWLLKIGIAVVDTPIVYGLVWLLDGEHREEDASEIA